MHRHLAHPVPFALVLLLTAACGGGAGAPPPSGVGPPAAFLVEAPLVVDVVLPAGAAYGPAELRVHNALGTWSVGAGGRADVAVWAGGPQLGEARTPSGSAYLLGWLHDGGGGLSARSTASVVLYFACGAFTLLPEQREEAIAWIEAHAATDQLALEITAALATGLDSLDAVLQAVEGAIADACLALGEARPVQPASVVRPGNLVSGIRIDTPGTGVIQIRNTFRRRATAYVRRLGHVAEGSSAFVVDETTPTRHALEPTDGFGSLLGLAYDFMFGNGAYVEKTSDLIPTPQTPVGAVLTRYEVCIVGPGVRQGLHFAGLSDEQTLEATRLWLRTAVFDLVLPLLANAVFPNGGKATEFFGDQETVELVAAIVGAFEKVPSLTAKALVGDAKGFFTDAIKLALEGPVKGDIYDVLRAFITRKTAGQSSLADLDFVLNGFLVLRAADAIGTAVDTAIQAYHIARSNLADRWEVEVLQPKVSVSPAFLRFFVGEEPSTQTLDVMVEEPAPMDADTGYRYRWTCTENVGFLTAAGQPRAASFVTSSSTVAYTREGTQTGEDSMLVEVFYLKGGAEVLVGKAQARAVVLDASPYLDPPVVSIGPGSSFSDFRVKFTQGAEATEPLEFVWSCDQLHGVVGQPELGVPVERRTAIYFARSDVDAPQVETLTVQVFGVREGERVELGTASAEIRIEDPDRRSVLPASMRIEVQPQADARVCHGPVIEVSPPDGARSMTLVGHHGFDPEFYGAEVSMNAARQSDGTWRWPSGFTPGPWFSPSSGCGPASGLDTYLGYWDWRFGGFSWYVVVTYE